MIEPVAVAKAIALAHHYQIIHQHSFTMTLNHTIP
jgi:hypothetical protein